MLSAVGQVILEHMDKVCGGLFLLGHPPGGFPQAVILEICPTAGQKTGGAGQLFCGIQHF